MYAKIVEQRRIVRAAALRRGVHARQAIGFQTKLGGRRIAEQVGVDVPRLLAGPDHHAALDWGRLPERCVVKPAWGAEGDGVRLLERDGNRWWDALSLRWWTSEELVDAYASLAGSGAVSTDLIVEERLGDGPPPFDWKVYTFAGDIGLVLQVDRMSGQVRWWSPEWEPLSRVHWTKSVDRTLPPPRNPKRLLDVASHLSCAVPVSFLRVDLYEDDGRVLLGELTSQPGSQRWMPGWDRRLGAMWEAAAARQSPHFSERWPSS